MPSAPRILSEFFKNSDGILGEPYNFVIFQKFYVLTLKVRILKFYSTFMQVYARPIL